MGSMLVNRYHSTPSDSDGGYFGWNFSDVGNYLY
jgi:hypothetical protein